MEKLGISDLVICKLTVTCDHAGIVINIPSVLHIKLDGHGIFGTGLIQILKSDLCRHITDIVEKKLSLSLFNKSVILDISELI